MDSEKCNTIQIPPNGTDRTPLFSVSVSVQPLCGKAKNQLTQTSKVFEGSREFYKKAD